MAKKVFASESPRMRRLRGLAASAQANNVCEQLTKVWGEGQAPARLAFRRTYARLDIAVTGVSDRNLPDRASRPPSTRLVLPRGVAQSFYLTTLFVAQCEVGPGGRPLHGRALSEPNPTTTGMRPWADLVVVPAERRPGTSTSHLVETNRARQLEAAVRKLASNDVRLVDLPHAGDTQDPLRNFVPLVESGLLGYASRTAYTVPLATEAVFTVPAAFFLYGWHGVLAPSEIAMLFAVWAGSPDDAAATSRVWLEGDTRVQRYGLGPDAYSTQAFLEQLGVLEVTVPPGRRPDGTFIGQKKGESPLLNSFRVLEDGFTKPALPVVMTTLKSAGL